MTTRKELLEAVVGKIADYREGEILPIDASHVETWVKQFPGYSQDPLLAELSHVFSKTYFSRKDLKQFLATVATSEKLTGGDPTTFWKNAGILNIQTAGNSQRDMLKVLDKALQKACDIGLAECGNNRVNHYVYIDDVLFSGGRVKHEMDKGRRSP